MLERLGQLDLPEPLVLPGRLGRPAPAVALSVLQVRPEQPEQGQLDLQELLRLLPDPQARQEPDLPDPQATLGRQAQLAPLAHKDQTCR